MNTNWGNGSGTLFLEPYKNGFCLLDYEYDTNHIHELGGGKNYYTSRSGLTGEGYLCNLNQLIPVGLYRVDTRYNDWIEPVAVAPGIELMMPFSNHGIADLKKFPVIIYWEHEESRNLIYTDFYNNFNNVLLKLLKGEVLEETPKFLSKTFFSPQRGEEVVESFNFYNFLKEKDTTGFNPWCFITKWLENYLVEKKYPHKEFYSLMRIGCLDGSLVRTTKIGSKFFATGPVDPDDPIPGDWVEVGDDIAYRSNNLDIQIIGWVDSFYYQKVAERVAAHSPLPMEQEAKFINFCLLRMDAPFVCIQQKHNKFLFFSEQKLIVAKVREEIHGLVRWEVENFLKEFLEFSS